MSDTKKTSFAKSLKAHEATIVEVAAVLTSAPRWIIAFSPVDRADLDRIIRDLGGFWDWASAVLSISFAVVEIWATMMVMRAFHKAKDGEKWVLGIAWVVSLVVLAVAQIPALYASLVGVKVHELEGAWPVLYIVAMSIAAFTVVAGVSYADRFKDRDSADIDESESENVWDDVTRTPELPVDAFKPFAEEADADDWWDRDAGQENVKGETVGIPTQLPTELAPTLTEPQTLQLEAPKQAEPTKADTRIVVNGYADFKAKMNALDGNRPQTGAQVDRMFRVARKTAYVYWGRYSAEKESQK